MDYTSEQTHSKATSKLRTTLSQQLETVLADHKQRIVLSLQQSELSKYSDLETTIQQKADAHNVSASYDSNIGAVVVSGNKNDVLAFFKSSEALSKIILIKNVTSEINIFSESVGLKQYVIRLNDKKQNGSNNIEFSPKKGGGASSVVTEAFLQKHSANFEETDNNLGGSVKNNFVSREFFETQLVESNSKVADVPLKSREINSFKEPYNQDNVEYGGTVSAINNTDGSSDEIPSTSEEVIAAPDTPAPAPAPEQPIPATDITTPSTDFSGTPSAPVTPTPTGLTLSITASLTDDLEGGNLADTFNAAQASFWHDSDTISGGAGSDVLNIASGTANLTLGASQYSNISEIERFVFADDQAHNITVEDSYFANGAGVENNRVTFDFSASTSQNVTLNASGLSAGNHVTVTASDRFDSLTGGAGDDIFTITGIQPNTTPSLLSSANLKLWLDAHDANGDGSDIADGTRISTWADKAGGDNNATQSGADSQAIVNTKYGNNGKELTFEKDFYNIDLSFLAGSEYHIFAIHSRESSLDRNYLLNTSPFTDNQSLHFGYRSTNSFTLAQYSNDIDVAIPNFTKEIVEMSYGTLDFANGHTVGITSNNVNYTNNNGNITPLISANNGTIAKWGSFFYNGGISEILVFDTSLNTSQQNEIFTYLGQKHNIRSSWVSALVGSVVNGGAGHDIVDINQNPLSIFLNDFNSNFISIEEFNLKGNDNIHRITVNDSYYSSGAGIDDNQLIVDATGNSQGVSVFSDTSNTLYSINIKGSDATDTIIGGAGGDLFKGNGGNDIIVGNSGIDTISYSGSRSEYIISGSEKITVFHTGTDGTDTISFTEVIEFADQTINLRTADETDNIIIGTLDNELFYSGGGDDTINGGNGDDTINAGYGIDSINGENGDDILIDASQKEITSPTDLDNAIIWLDGQDVNGDGSIVLNGSKIATWVDKAGGDNNAVQTNIADQAVYQTNIINGKGALNFTTDHYDIDLSFMANSDYTIFSVIQRNSPGSQNYFLATTPDVSDRGLHFGYRDSSTATLAHFGNDIDTTVPSYTTPTPAMITGEYDSINGKTLTIVQNNTEYKNSHASTTPLLQADNGTLGIWDRTSVKDFRGHIAELIIFDTSLTSASYEAVQNYLSAKYQFRTIDDTFTGGVGNDIFQFGARSGNDIITDFENPGSAIGDIIRLTSNLNSSGITDWASLAPNINQSGLHTVIELDPANAGLNTLTLQNTIAANLSAADFEFV